MRRLQQYQIVIFSVLLLITVIFFQNCSGFFAVNGGTSVGASSVFSVSPANLPISLGQSGSFIISGGITPYKIAIQSSDIASASGLNITGTKIGTTTVTITDSAGSKFTASVTVSAVCTAGQAQSCTRSDGTPGTQMCSSDGTGFGECGLSALPVEISLDRYNLDLFTEAGSPTYPVQVNVTINAGVRVGSENPSFPALTTGALPAGSQVNLVNNGSILGAGGLGGAADSAGQAGGPAMSLSMSISITNNGQIFGGGGGGGGGLTFLIAGGTGGNGCGANFGTSITETKGSPGTGYVFGFNGGGGDGGCWGQPGNSSQGAGGSAGAAILLNGNSVNWISGNTPTQVLGPVQ